MPKAAVISASEPKFIVIGDWSHIFNERTGEQDCRVVFDTDLNEVVHLHVKRAGAWHVAKRDDMLDVGQSLKEANSEVLEDPVAAGHSVSDELPEWAKQH